MSTQKRDPRKITAQIATEAVVNSPSDYSPADIAAVRAEAIAAGVSAFYVDMLPVRSEAWLSVSPFTGHAYDCQSYVTIDESDCDCAGEQA